MSNWIKAYLAALMCMAIPALAGTLTFDTYYHNDHLGSPVAASDERSDLLWRAHFRPYGERQENPADAAFGNVGYTGHMQDADSNLVYMQARYYDPLIGRFLAIDPVGVNSEIPDSFNRYAYVTNNPYRHTDPDGRMKLELIDNSYVGADVWIPAIGGGGGFSQVGPAGGLKKGLVPQGELITNSPIRTGGITKATGRSGKQARLRELANDDKLGSADRGWIKQEINSISRGQRKNIRNPPGKDLAHERGREAAKGYRYEHSNLQDRDLHRLQHKYDNFGRSNKERPPQ